MDRTGIIVVSLCGVLLVLWFFQTQKQEARFQQQQAEFARTNIVSTPQATANQPTIPATMTTAVQVFDTNAPENLIVISNADARYTFTSRGGGLKSVELLKYPETISARWKKENESSTNGVATLNARASVPVLAILGDTSLVGDGNFTLTRTDDGVRAEKFLPDGLLLTKEFHLSSNYLVNASVRFEKHFRTSRSRCPRRNWSSARRRRWMRTTTECMSARCGLTARTTLTTARAISTRTRRLFLDSCPGLRRRNFARARATSSGRRRTISFSRCWRCLKHPAQQIVARPVNLPPLTIEQFLLQLPNGNPDGAGLSGANIVGKFNRSSGRLFFTPGQRNIERWHSSARISRITRIWR